MPPLQVSIIFLPPLDFRALQPCRDMSSLSTARKLTAPAQSDVTARCFIARSAILRRSITEPMPIRAPTEPCKKHYHL